MNNLIIPKILIAFIISGSIFNANSSKESFSAELEEQLNDIDLDLLDEDSSKIYVHLDQEIIEYFNKLDLKEESDLIRSMKEHVKSHKLAERDFTLEVLNQTIDCCKKQNNLDYLNIFENYKTKLENGENLVIRNDITRGRKTKCYYCLKVRNRLSTRSLYVRKSAKICGNLCVKKNLGVNGNAIVSKTLTVPDISTKNLAINGNPAIVSALASVTNYGFLSGQATLSFPSNFMINNLSGTFKVIPQESYITIPSNLGTLKAFNLTPSDPLIQLLDSLEFECGSTHTSITPLADKLHLYGLNLSFNVEIQCTSFNSSNTPKVNVSFENLPVALNQALFQLDPVDNNIDDFGLLGADGEVCYPCSSIYICRSKNITRAYSNALAAVRAVIPSVNNISISSNGTLSFTVNISVLAYDTESDAGTTLPMLSALISQFFQGSSIVFTVNGIVTKPSCVPGFVAGKTC